ncbi:MAG: D-lactate dehydrogenase [Candidatus Heimdallarchaeota archaeon LC_3]|nr:MAG: D-lactate dehydrogenase [Candidatus Heimdallarchaeota archaeon LC_3]
MKIAFFEVKSWEIDYLTKLFRTEEDFDLTFTDQPLNQKNVENFTDINIASVFIYSTINKSVLKSLNNLKFIATRSTGFDHIDLTECDNKNILISNVPYYGENTIAEHTFGLILALSRNIHKSYVRTQRNDYSIEGLKGFDLQGRTLGIIGLGRIGMHVARIARGFGMKVLAYDIKQDSFFSDLINFTYTSFEEVLKLSDIVTLHVPYNKHTHHLINKNTIKLFKKGAVLINTARGGVVETESLLEALENKTLSGIGLDVIEGEEYIKEEKQLLYDSEKIDIWKKIIQDHILLKKDNVVFTPHIAFYSQEALERILQTTKDNIKGFTSNRPQFIVTNK